MILVAGVALALLVIVLLRSGASNEHIITRLGTERDPRVITAAADVLEARGMRLTAEVLRARARSLGGAGGQRKPPTTAKASGESSPVLASPFTEATDAVWTTFVRALAGPAQSTRTDAGRLGRFAIHLRRMAELRCVRDVRRADDGRVIADWVRPLTEETFLADPRLQYRALVMSLRGLRRDLLARQVPVIGQRIDGQRATVSGLLAVAHRLGIVGLEAWLEAPAVRQRQRVASSLFERVNGLF